MKTLDEVCGLPDGGCQKMVDDAVAEIERQNWERRLRIRQAIHDNKEKLNQPKHLTGDRE